MPNLPRSDSNGGKTLWQRIRDVPAFLAALIAVVSATARVVTWVAGYFATQQQLAEARCLLSNQVDSLAFQIEQLAFYDRYLKLTREIAVLEEADILTPSARATVQTKKAERQEAWNAIKDAQTASKKALRRNAAGTCNTLLPSVQDHDRDVEGI